MQTTEWIKKQFESMDHPLEELYYPERYRLQVNSSSFSFSMLLLSAAISSPVDESTQRNDVDWSAGDVINTIV